jgi:addiction module RelE/StbE family toxin
MKRLELEKPFRKKSKKILSKNPSLHDIYGRLLTKLANNPFDPTLHTHALTGELKGKYACSLTYELRVIFKLYDDIVHLIDIGTHDEVY